MRRHSRTLSRREAREVYDRIGAVQDKQGFYEDPATDVLLGHGAFDSAAAVFELGCGTGRFAARLLAQHLPPSARYRGVDASPRMVGLARSRLAPYGSRAEVALTDGEPPAQEPTGSCDRWVSNYVFDLLSHAMIEAMLREAHRMLAPGGLLCLSGLSTGVGLPSRTVARVWGRVQARWPRLVGGCRPIEVLPLLGAARWQVVHHEKVAPFAIPSEALVAKRLEEARGP